jgi:hypothetical protein
MELIRAICFNEIRLFLHNCIDSNSYGITQAVRDSGILDTSALLSRANTKMAIDNGINIAIESMFDRYSDQKKKTVKITEDYKHLDGNAKRPETFEAISILNAIYSITIAPKI